MGAREQLDEAGRPAAFGGWPGSRFTVCLRSAFANVLFVVDVAKVKARGIDQIGDYLADLAFAQPLLSDDCVGLGSILDVMADRCEEAITPAALTDFDIAYLRSLYQTNVSLLGYLSRTEIASYMARMIKADRLDAR